MRSEQLREIVEQGGATFVGIQEGHPHGPIVLFHRGEKATTLCLFVWACKTPRDVRCVLAAKGQL